MDITPTDKVLRPVALITGASSGIGYELAKTFAANHFNLIIAAEDQGIFEAAHNFRNMGIDVEAVQTNLATSEGINKLVSVINLHSELLDSAALNAGVGVSGEFIQTDLQEELNLIQLNIIAVVRLTKALLPIFLRKKRGRILFTSSIAADMPGPFYAVYAASKAFVQSFAEAIRVEVKEHGLTITSLQPGATDTNFFARAHMTDTKAGAGKKDDPAEVAVEGFKALMEGKDHVVAGSFKNKIQSTLGKLLPESTGARIQGESTKPGSALH